FDVEVWDPEARRWSEVGEEYSGYFHAPAAIAAAEKLKAGTVEPFRVVNDHREIVWESDEDNAPVRAGRDEPVSAGRRGPRRSTVVPHPNPSPDRIAAAREYV